MPWFYWLALINPGPLIGMWLADWVLEGEKQVWRSLPEDPALARALSQPAIADPLYEKVN